ncbi:putative DD41D transposase [Trichonephila clavipes]|nr:putative DD41D transposase [Trichonephila clavipes]
MKLESPRVSSLGFDNDSKMMVISTNVTTQVAPMLQLQMRSGIWQLLPKVTDRVQHQTCLVSSLQPLVQLRLRVGGCSNLVVKVSDFGRHVMSSSPVPLKILRVGQRCTLNLSRVETSSRCCQVIHSQFSLAIHQNDHQARRRFVEWAPNEIAVVPDFHKRILFKDEAHFWLNGYVNKQNGRLWSGANPQVYVETPLHPEKLTVWCAL